MQGGGVYLLHAEGRPQDHDLVRAIVFRSEAVVHCDVHLWQLDLESDIPVPDFEPLAAARPTVPLITARVWPEPPQERAQRKTLRVRPLQALVARGLAPIADEANDPIEDAVYGIDGPDGEQRCILDIAAELLYDAAGVPPGWSVSSDDEEQEDEEEGSEDEVHPGNVPDPVLPGVLRAGLLACLRHGARPAEIPAPPVPEVLAPHRDRRAAWPQVNSGQSSGSYLRLF